MDAFLKDFLCNRQYKIIHITSIFKIIVHENKYYLKKNLISQKVMEYLNNYLEIF